MASSGKKGKKKKTTLSIHEFLGPKADELVNVVVKPTKSWADEMEQQGNDLDDDPSTRIVINRSALPTAPRSSRGVDVDLSRVPKEKPFTAFLANLPFEVSEDDIRHFFKDLGIATIRLLTDTSGRLRGSGYVEFETREMLIEALNYAEAMLKGRAIRVDLADHHDKSDRDGGFRNRDRDRDDGDDKTLGDWRKKEESSSDRFSGRERRDAFDRDRGSEHDRPDGKDRYSSDRFDDRGGESRRGWGGSGSRDGDRYGSFGNRQDRGSHDDRDREFSRSSFGSSFRNRDQFQHESDRFGGRDSGRRSEDRFRNDNRSRNDDGYRSDDRHRNDDGHRNDDWRQTDRPESDRFRNSERRDARFQDGDKYRDGGDRNERDKSDGRFSGRYRDNDRDFPDRNRDVRGSNDRGPGRDEKEEERGQERGHEQGQTKGHERGRDDDKEVASSANRSRDVSTEKERSGPKGRPKLNLQPRTKPLDEAGQMTYSSSIFGGAKPVDTTQKLREIEEKHSSKLQLRQRPEKEDGVGHEEDRQPSPVKQQTSSEGLTSEENSVYKRQNSANSKNRHKKEVTPDGSGSEKRRERNSNTSGSSGRGSASGRKTSHSETDEASNVDPEVFADKAAPPPLPPAVKMVPAPPPKENFWEKRRTAQHQAVATTTASVQPPITDREDAAEVAETNVELAREHSIDVSDELTVEVSQVSLASDAMATSSDSSSPRTAPEERSAEPTTVDAPVVNVWEARRKENEAKTQKVEKPLEAPSHDGEVRKRATVSIADVKEFGGHVSGTAEPTDRWPGGTRGARRGGTGVRRSEGSEVRRSDPDGKRTGSKKEKDKPLPASIDEMPKLEDKSKKDWSDRNKFSSLQLEEEDNGSDVEKKDSDRDDN